MVINIFSGILFLIWLVCLIMVIICSNNTLYCYVFEREDIKVFYKLLKVDSSLFDLCYEDRNAKYYICSKYPEMEILVYNNTAIVFANDKCIASRFYRRGSRKLAEKLLKLREK